MPPPPDLVVQAGTVHTMAGAAVTQGAVVTRGGRIVAVTPRGDTAGAAKVLDFGDCVVMPGLIDCASQLFLLGGERGTGEKIAPHFDVVDGLDPYDRAREQVLRQGVTSVYLSPGSRGALGGQTALVKLNGAQVRSQFCVKRGVAVKGDLGVSLDNTSSSLARLADYLAIREELIATQRYLDDLERHERASRLYDKQQGKDKKPNGKAAENGGNGDGNGKGNAKPDAAKKDDKKRERPKPFKRDPVREALAPVVRGEVPLQLEAHREDSIRNALRLRQEFGLRLILEGATEADRLIDEIAAAQVEAVIVTPESPSFRLGPQLDLREASADTAASLHQAGVTVLLGTGGTNGKASQFLHVAMAAAVRGGLSRSAALRAVTAEAARAFGVEDRVGRLAEGCDADMVVFTGDPFAPETRVQAVFVDGELVYGGAP